MYISNTYKRFPIKIQRAKGIWIYDTNNNKYLDTFSGIGVLSFGHSDEIIKNAIKEKINRYTHISNFFLDEDALYIAKRLVNETGKDGNVFFANSGTEANETALKAIKKLKKGIIVSFTSNFHGRTIGSLSITGFEHLRKNFEPLLNDVVFLPFNDIQAFKNFVEKNGEKISAVFLECVHGSGGLDTVSSEFIDVINKFKYVYDYIVVADEVQAGLGRTGKFYSYKHFNLDPDIITVAKSLGGGLPLSATIFTGKYKDVFMPGDHGSTFAPNPVALAAGRTVIERLTEDFLKEISEKSIYFKNRLAEIQKNLSINYKIKGLGLMIGVEIYSQKINQIIEIAISEKLLLNVVKNNTVRFLPPLNITKTEIDEIIFRFEKVIKKLI
ncbi:MAG: aminotransferase class III-fold pyridoxal phosphate-dependent enzyme [Thermosipho sp. (in: Bacteria)]|nr:aminotransferase class III-fold pyridoxal phosphate-dependent enzyme [Thermosipho sp. (in: thermotogales)]